MAHGEFESRIEEFVIGHRDATRREVADHVGCSVETVKRSTAWKSKKNGSLDALRWLDWAAQGEDLHREINDEATRLLRWSSKLGEDPFGIVGLGDAHLLTTATDHRRFCRDYKEIRDDQRLFAIVLGDMIEAMTNGFKSAEPVHSQMASPSDQCRIMWSLVRGWHDAGKMVAASGGNHEEHFTKLIGFNPALDGLRRMMVPVFEGKGLISVSAADFSFYVLTQHQGGGTSRFSKTAACRNSYLNDFPASVVLSAHTHNFGITWDEHYPLARMAGESFGGDRLEITCGTYRTGYTSFGAKIGGSGGRYSVPGFIVIPREKRIVPFKYIEDAQRYLDGIGK